MLAAKSAKPIKKKSGFRVKTAASENIEAMMNVVASSHLRLVKQ
jgi:hypothetical protein